MSVLAAYHNAVESEHFFGYAYHVVACWDFDGVIVFAFDFSFAHDITSDYFLIKSIQYLNTLVSFFNSLTGLSSLLSPLLRKTSFCGSIGWSCRILLPLRLLRSSMRIDEIFGSSLFFVKS